MGQRTRPLDDLDAALAEADALLSGGDDLDAALREADALLAAPAPTTVRSSRVRATPPADPSAAPAAVPVRAATVPAPAPRAARPGTPAVPVIDATMQAVLDSPATRSHQVPSWGRAPVPPGTPVAPPTPTLTERLQRAVTTTPAEVLGGAARGFAAGTVGTAANTAGLLTAGAYAKNAEEARRLTAPAAYARETLTPPLESRADILEDPGVMLDPAWWSYMTGQLAGSVASLAGTGAGGRVVGAAAASKLATRAPALAAKLAALGGPAAATGGEALVEAADVFTSLVQEGKDPAEAAREAERVFAGNVALLGLTNHPLFDAGGRGLAQVVKRAAVEGSQEVGQQAMANVATGQDVTAGLGTAGLLGALGGPAAGAVLDRQSRPSVRSVAPGAPTSPAGGPVSTQAPTATLRQRLEAAVADSQRARAASSFGATPAAAGDPNADLAAAVAEADAVLAETTPRATAEPPAPATAPAGDDLDAAVAEADAVLSEEAPDAGGDRIGPHGWRDVGPPDPEFPALGTFAPGDRVRFEDYGAKRKRNAPAPEVEARLIGPDPKSRNRVEVELADGTRAFYNVAMPVKRAGETFSSPPSSPAAPPAAPEVPEATRRYLLQWMSDDLHEMGFEQGGATSIHSGPYADMTYEGTKDIATSGSYVFRPHVAGTPLQEMFAAQGVTASRGQIAGEIQRYLDGRMRTPTKAVRAALNVLPALDAAWDAAGQRFDFSRVPEELLAAANIDARNLRSPITRPTTTGEYYPADVLERFERSDQQREHERDYRRARQAEALEQGRDVIAQDIESTTGAAAPDDSFDVDAIEQAADESDDTVRARTVAQVEAAPDAYIDRYLRAFPDRVLAADNASELFPEYAKDATTRATRGHAVRPAASAVVERAFTRLLAESPPPGRKRVVSFTSGGNGSGKSTSIDPDGPHAFAFDSTLSQEAPSVAKIDRARAADFGVHIEHVSVDPVVAWRRVLDRAMGESEGRTVTLAGHAATHQGARETLFRIAERYASDPAVKIRVWENGDRGYIGRSLDWLRQQAYPSGDALRAQLRAELDAAHAAGRLSDAVYAGALGESLHDRRGVRGKRPADSAGRARADSGPPAQAPVGDDLDAAVAEADRLLAEPDEDLRPMAQRPVRERLDALRAAKPPAGRGTRRLTGPQLPTPGTTPLAKVATKARPADLVRDMAKLFDVPVGVGRLGARAWGWYAPRLHAVRLKIANDLPVAMHEFGHAAERHLALNLADRQWVGELMTLGQPTSTPSYTPKQIRMEGLAEFFRLWVLSPQDAQQRAPRFYAALEGRLDTMGELGKGLRDLQKRAQSYVSADPMARVALKIDFDGAGTHPLGSWLERATVHWIDDLQGLKRAVDAMAGGHPIPATLNAYLLARNARGAVNRAADFLDAGVRNDAGQFIGPSLKTALQPVAKDLERFAIYLVALRARELHARQIETGLGAAEVRQTIDEIEQGPDAQRFAQARDGVYAFQAAMLNYARRAGLLNKDQQAAIEKLNQFYVPFQRVLDRDGGPGTGRRIADRLSPIKKIKGSGRDIVNPLESIVKNTFALVDTVEKNRAMYALVELARTADERKIPGSGPGRWLRAIQDPQTVTGVRLRDALLEASQKAGNAVFTNLGPNIDPALEQALNDLNIDPDQVLPIFQTAFQGPKGQQIVTVLDKGERRFFQVEDPALYEAITQIAPAARFSIPLANIAASTLRAGATLTLGFIARNPGRDTLTAFLQSRHGFVPVVDTVRGAIKTVLHELGVRHDEDVAQFWASGVTQAALVGADRKVLRQKVRQLADPAAHVRSVLFHPLELLQALSAFSEVSTRVGEFSLALKQGGAPHTIWQRILDRQRQPMTADALAAATLAARDVTTDFSRAGTTARELNRIAAFFNARVQGYVRIAETVRSRPQAVALNVGMLAAAAVLLKLLNDDDDDYRELAEWEKLTYWHWRPTWGGGSRADAFLRIPKPFEWAFIPNVAEAAVDYARDRDPEAFRLLKAQVRENSRQLLLGFLPTALLPSLEVTANYATFRQGPIVSPWDLDLPLEQQASDWTSQTARALTRLGVPLAPAKIDHWLFAHTAGLGRAVVTSGIDPALRLTGIAPPARTEPAKRWEDTPGLGVFVRSAAPRSDAESLVEFYEAYRDMTGQERGARKAAAAGDRPLLDRIRAGVEDRRWRGREARMKAAKKRLDDLMDEIDKVYTHASMTPQQKLTNLEGMRRAAVYEARAGLGYIDESHMRRSTR